MNLKFENLKWPVQYTELMISLENDFFQFFNVLILLTRTWYSVLYRTDFMRVVSTFYRHSTKTIHCSDMNLFHPNFGHNSFRMEWRFSVELKRNFGLLMYPNERSKLKRSLVVGFLVPFFKPKKTWFPSQSFMGFP